MIIIYAYVPTEVGSQLMVQFGDRIDYDFTILGAKITDKNSPCYGF